MNRFLFTAWNIGFAFGAASLVKGCEYWDEIELWEVERVEMAACVVGRKRDCVRWILTKDIVVVVGIELWMSLCSFVCLVFGESMRYLH